MATIVPIDTAARLDAALELADFACPGLQLRSGRGRDHYLRQLRDRSSVLLALTSHDSLIGLPLGSRQDSEGRWREVVYRRCRRRADAAGEAWVVAPASRFLMITGVGPGIGKSTLAEGLADRARELGQDLDLFGEEQIFTRPAFAEIGRAFRERRDGVRVYPDGAMLLEGYRRVLAGLGDAVLVFDWTCLAMISDLPWAEGRPDVLLAHARDVLDLTAPLRPVIVNLKSDVEIAVARAAAQRGEDWVRRMAHLAAMSGATARTRLGAISERIRGLPFESLELDAFVAAGWPIWEVDAAQPATTVLDEVARRLWPAREENRA